MPRKTENIFTLALLLAVTVGILLFTAGKSVAAEITVYKSPSCGCCTKWADHFSASGHAVNVKPVKNMGDIKEMLGVPYGLESCHTAIVGGYVVEGHVPAKDIEWLLSERPKIKGLAVPGMPMGSLGMEGDYADAYNVMLLKSDGSVDIHAKY